MSTQNSPHVQQELTAILNAASPHERWQFAVRVLDAYKQQVRDTKQVLDPAMLRTLQANVEALRQHAN